jgi:hypothetical protein
MAKRLNTLLKPRPNWSIPAEEDLHAAVPAKLIKRVDESLSGLEHVEIGATYLNDAGTKIPAATFQHFNIDEGGRGRMPPISSETLAGVVYVRCQQYAANKRRKVTFSVVLSGSSARGRAFNETIQFQYDGTPSAEEVMETDTNSDDFDPRDDPSDNTTDNIEGTTGELAEVMPAIPNAALSALASPEMQSLAIFRVVQAAFAGANAEHRAFAQQLRTDRTESIREARALVTTVTDKMKEHTVSLVESMKEHTGSLMTLAADIARAANDRANAAEEKANARIENAERRVQELTRLDGAQAEALMGIARQGWQAFEDGMRMRSDAIGLQQEYDRAYLGMQLQAAQSGQRKSAAGGVMKTVLPFAATGLSAFLRSRGDEKSADMIDFFSGLIATGGAGMTGPTPTPGPEPAAHTTYQPPQGNGQRVEQPTVVPPIVAAVRQFFDSLRSDQRENLRRILPGPVWQLLEGAADTDIEAACYACLTQIQFFLSSDKPLQAKIMLALDPVQQQQLFAIIAAVTQGNAQGPAPADGAPGSNGASNGGSNGHASAHEPPSAPGRKMPPRPGATPPV